MNKPRRYRRPSYVTTMVEVDVDIADVLETLDDDELAEYGLVRIAPGGPTTREPSSIEIHRWAVSATMHRTQPEPTPEEAPADAAHT